MSSGKRSWGDTKTRPSYFSPQRSNTLNIQWLSANIPMQLIIKNHFQILSNRIKPLLPNLISKNQGGFVPSRHIMDNILIVQEALHSSLARKE